MSVDKIKLTIDDLKIVADKGTTIPHYPEPEGIQIDFDILPR